MQVFWWLLSLVVAIIVAWLLLEEFVGDKSEEEAEAEPEGGEPAAEIESLTPRPEAVEGAIAPSAEAAAVAETGEAVVVADESAVAVAAAVASEEAVSESEETAEEDAAAAESGEPAADDSGETAESAPEEAGEESAEKVEATRTAAAVVIAGEGSYPDNLTLVKGIGKVYQRRLYESGIFTWHQVTEADVDKLREICDAIDAANVHDWPRQASLLAAKYDREGATYAGDVPDDLTRIDGIGQVGLQRLYKAGIMTFGQAAAASPGELSTALGSGDEPAAGDFDAMIAQAATLASA